MGRLANIQTVEQAGRGVAAVPVVVPNTLWKAADQEAYRGGQQSDITHLAEFEVASVDATMRAGLGPWR